MNPVIIGNSTLYHGDCLEILPTLPKVDAVITDPPYGASQEKWDMSFPVAWWPYAKIKSETQVIITGSCGLADSIALAADGFIDVIAARNLNGMTRGPLGFCNWLAAVVCGTKCRQGVNAFDFSVRGAMPDHPTPKPIEYMVKLIARVTDAGSSVLDPFMGSGTTGVACMNLGRKFIGIEIEKTYFDIACERIDNAQRQQRLFA